MHINERRKGREVDWIRGRRALSRMACPRFILILSLYALLTSMTVHGKKTEDEVTVVIQSSTPSLNETSALETVEKMAVEAKDFVVDSVQNVVHKVGELVRIAVETLQEFIKGDDNSVTNSTIVPEATETPPPKRKSSKKKKSKKSFTTTTIPEEDEEDA